MRCTDAAARWVSSRAASTRCSTRWPGTFASTSGARTGPIIDAAAKAASLREWAEATGTPLSATVAIGDGANDLEMMAVAAIGVAFNGKPLVRERADVSIEGDLSLAIPLLERLS
jgi:phosphoserine phosphatase